MAFIEKQQHGRHDYFYLVKNVRTGPSKVEKFRIFLGREIPKQKELQRFHLELEKKSMVNYETRWLSKELVERIDDLRASVVVFHKTPADMLPKDFLVRYTYNTNAIEGNKLTLRQTALILSDRIAPSGARTNDVMEALNSADAWEFIKSYKNGLNKTFVCKVQYEVTKNTSCRIQGDYRDSEVKIMGSEHIPPLPSYVPNLIENLFREFKEEKKKLHPVELASILHNRFVNIHPFTEGNGRTARLMMNWVLFRNKYPPVIIEFANKEYYYNAIEAADKGDSWPFVIFLANQLLKQYTTPVED